MRKFKIFLTFSFFLFALSWVLIPVYYTLPYKKPPGPLLDDRLKKTYQDHLVETQPELVLLGDSTLLDSIDEPYLAELLDKDSYRIGKPGSASAIWYLLLKNNIITSPHKPSHLIIFFRGSMLTSPEYRTRGKYEPLVTELALSDDFLLQELAYTSQMGWLEEQADQFLPLFAYRQHLRTSIERLVKYKFFQKMMDVERIKIDQALDVVFGEPDIAQVNAVINAAEDYLYQPEKLDFYSQLPKSFLPEIVRLCHENNIQLTVVRTKSLTYASSEEAPKGLDAYISNLQEYLAENKIVFIDYAEDERLPVSLFNDSVHMSKNGAEIFTEIFAADYQDILANDENTHE